MVTSILFDYQNIVQLLGAIFILVGYYLMAKDALKSSVFLALGCAVWAYWATLVTPFPFWLFLLEFILGLLSVRTFLHLRKSVA